MKNLLERIEACISRAQKMKEADPEICEVYFEIEDVPVNIFKSAAAHYSRKMVPLSVTDRAFFQVSDFGKSYNVTIYSVPCRLVGASVQDIKELAA